MQIVRTAGMITRTNKLFILRQCVLFCFGGGGHVGLTSDPHASAHSCLYLTLMLNADFLYNIHRAYVELISSHLV